MCFTITYWVGHCEARRERNVRLAGDGNMSWPPTIRDQPACCARRPSLSTRSCPCRRESYLRYDGWYHSTAGKLSCQPGLAVIITLHAVQ